MIFKTLRAKKLIGGNIIFKNNKVLLFISIIFVSLIAISVVSAADNINDTVAVSDDSSVVAIDSNDEIVNVNVEDTGVAVSDSDDEIVSAADKEIVVSKGSNDDSLKINFTGSGSGSSFNISNIDFGSLFNGTTISFGNGTSFNFTDLFNGTTLSFGNGTSFNISVLLNGTFSFGNGTNSTFDFSSILNIFGGTKETINATDIEKVYTTKTDYSAVVMKGNETLTTGTVIFTIDNKEINGRIGSDGVAKISISNLKPGTHYIISEYGDVLTKNVITVKKANPKLTAKNKSFKVKTKTKKYTVTLKTNENKVLKNTKVTIKVKGKTYTAKTNSKGQATFKLNKLTKTGKFTATVKSAATACYNSQSAKVTITVKK